MRILRLLATCLPAVCVFDASHLGAQGNDPLRVALARRVDEAKQGTGAVVGLLTPEGRSFAAYGRVSLDGTGGRARHRSGDRLSREAFHSVPAGRHGAARRGAVALLGHALSLRAGLTFEDLLRRRLLEPLGMTSTAISIDAEQRSRQAVGHNSKRSPVPPWTGGVMAPTGEAKSSASDMLTFAAAVLDPSSPLKASFARMTAVRRPLEDSRTQQALGWSIFRRNQSELLGHNGSTFGFESRLVVDTTRKRRSDRLDQRVRRRSL